MMNKIQTNHRNQQSEGKSNKQLAQDTPVSTQDNSNNQAENTEEVEGKSINQRRPQFLLNENMKGRYR